MKCHVYYINCDCVAYYDARRQPVRANCHPRCRYCKTPLGFMQADYIGAFEGETENDAIVAAQAAHFKRTSDWAAARQAEREAKTKEKR